MRAPRAPALRPRAPALTAGLCVRTGGGAGSPTKFTNKAANSYGAAGRPIANESVEAATGVEAQAGKKLIGADTADYGASAGKASAALSAQMGVPLAQPGDTSASKKQSLFHGNHSTVDSVVFGHELDNSDNADKRDFSDAAGTPSKALEQGGIFNNPRDPNKAFALRSVADQLIFGRDVDGLGDADDPRDFSGAAGNRSASAEHSGLFAAKAERVAFEDIPHSQFAPPGKRSVKALGSRAEEIIYARPESVEDDNYVEVNPAFRGAAGESSKQASERVAAEMLSNKTKLHSGDSSVDKLIFGRDLDNSAADDDMEDQLYSGAGTRSNCQFNPFDVSTRSTDLRTDGMLYGNVSVVGSDIDAAYGEHRGDPRDFGDAAGSSTSYLSEHELCAHDITKRLINAAGSSAINPSEADELIFGRNVDKSGEDLRDFENSAGGGARLRQHNRLDITTNAPKRLQEGATMTEADRLIYGHSIGGEGSPEGACGSRPDARTAGGVAGGVGSKSLAQGFVAHASGERRNKMVTGTTFDVIRGGASTLQRDLLETNVGSFDGAGVTSLRLSEKVVKEHKRAEPVDMVADPHLPPGMRELKPMKKAEFAALHAAQADDLIYQHDLGDSAMGEEARIAGEAMFDGCAGVSSKGLASIRTQSAAPPQFPGEGPKPDSLAGAAGVQGSVASRLEASKKAQVEHRTETLSGSVQKGDKARAATATRLPAHPRAHPLPLHPPP